MKIGWSNDVIVLDANAPALQQIRRVDSGIGEWVLIRWDRTSGRRPVAYALSRNEFFKRLRTTRVPYDPNTRVVLSEVLRLRELAPSIWVDTGTRLDNVQSMPRRPAGQGDASTILTYWRYVDLQWGPADAFRAAIGGPDVGTRTTLPDRPRTTRGGPSFTGHPPTAMSPAPEQVSDTRASGTEEPATDEGIVPVRYPSIEAEGSVQSGEPITLSVDLLREESANTLGGTAFPEMAADWKSFTVDVALSCPDIEFDHEGRATLEVQRNAASKPARVSGRVRAGLAVGHSIQVKAKFVMGQRFCGSATRMLALDGAKAPDLSPGTPVSVVQLDTAAAQPDLTVEIVVADPDKPHRLTWSMWSRAFRGRPPKLNGVVDLGQKPEAEASALFNRFAKLERGQHQEAIEGFGEELWAKSPAEFQAMYWALCDFVRGPLTIQFITDDPYMPWELMNPYRQGEQHGPIAMRHAVARWLLLYKGYMENKLPKGDLLAMAPRYDAGRDLPLAEAAAQALVKQLGAQRVQGKRAQFLELFESPPQDRIALFYFTGHGAFSSDTAGASRLKLEDGAEITPMEVKRQKIKLGERDGTVVFLNACEVGATGSVLGNVGGWADAFLARGFRAFIAPLWAIDEEDAAQVTAELMEAIVTREQPLGAALRDLRRKYGAVSPTFYSYLLYGDVTARLGTA